MLLRERPANRTPPQYALAAKSHRPDEPHRRSLQPASVADSAVRGRAGRDTMLWDERPGWRARLESPGGFLLQWMRNRLSPFHYPPPSRRGQARRSRLRERERGQSRPFLHVVTLSTTYFFTLLRPAFWLLGFSLSFLTLLANRFLTQKLCCFAFQSRSFTPAAIVLDPRHPTLWIECNRFFSS